MRIAVAGLLLLLVAGCAAPAPAPTQWAFKETLKAGKQVACDVSATQPDPVLGAIQAFGLQPHEPWLPGLIGKVNWEEQPLTPGAMDVELRRPGSEAVAYRMHRQTGPSLISFPEPGCWDLTVRTTAKSATVRLWHEAAHPVGLRAGTGEYPSEPEATTGEWRDEQFVLKLLDAAAGNPPAPAKGRSSAMLWIVWETPGVMQTTGGRLGHLLSPVVYVPAAQGEGAQVILQKSLITGDCRDAGLPLPVAITPELATQLEQQLGVSLRVDESEKNPWQLITGSCAPFEKP